MPIRHASRVVAKRRPGIEHTPNANRIAINVLVHGRRRTSRPQGARRAIVAKIAHEVQPASMRNTVDRLFCLEAGVDELVDEYVFSAVRVSRRGGEVGRKAISVNCNGCRK